MAHATYNIIDVAKRVLGDIDIDPATCAFAQSMVKAVRSSWLIRNAPSSSPRP
jgi:hypothetical protein